MNTKRIALLAGAGDLPKKIANILNKNNVPFVLIFFHGISSSEGYPAVMSESFSLGKIGMILSFLKKQNVGELILSGYFSKPTFKQLAPDFKGAQWLARLAMKKGDNDYLSLLAELIEKEGLSITNPDHLVGKELFLSEGVHTKTKPNKEHMRAFERARDVLRCLSPADVGQAVVVEGNDVIAIEAAEGTLKLIRRSAPYIKSSQGILVKMSKTDQDLRLDRPTIGMKTIQAAYESHLAGIFVEANVTYVLDQEPMIEFANRHKMFIQAMHQFS